MSKKKFKSPELKIIQFQRKEDIITASTDPFDGVWVPIVPQNNGGNNDFFS